MSNNETITNYTIKPHGGELINRVVEGNERERLIEEALKFKPNYFKYLGEYRI